jgi:hypothetical protein
VLAVAGRWQAVVRIVSTALRIRWRLPFFATTLRTAAGAANPMHEQTAPQYAAPARARRGVRRRRQHLEHRRKVVVHELVLCKTHRRGVERGESESAAAALRFAQVTPVRQAGVTS